MKDRSAVPPIMFEKQLEPEQETKFWSWLKKQHSEKKIGDGDYNFYVRNGYGYDYDFREAFSQDKNCYNPETKHWDDVGKKPNHSTFSNESVYAKEVPEYAGHWEGDLYVPPKDENFVIPEMQDGNLLESSSEAGTVN